MSIQHATLPITHEHGLRMEPQEAKALGALLADDYARADPFPHIVIDGILPTSVIDEIKVNFPTEALKSDLIFNIGYGGQHKRQVMPEECNQVAREFFHFMNSAPVLRFLEGLTGIEGLIPDPYFSGGGFHETTRGGKLGVHADFRINEELHLQRRLNLLIYLNERWDDSWKGHLELWDKEMKTCRASVAPIYNRCVVFSTDADTWHGHPDELMTPDGVTRRSIALYYYTASRSVYKEVPNLSTMYQARPDDSAAIKAEAQRFKNDQYLKDWLPPVLERFVHRVVDKTRRMRG